MRWTTCSQNPASLQAAGTQASKYIVSYSGITFITVLTYKYYLYFIVKPAMEDTPGFHLGCGEVGNLPHPALAVALPAPLDLGCHLTVLSRYDRILDSMYHCHNPLSLHVIFTAPAKILKSIFAPSSSPYKKFLDETLHTH